MSSKQEQGLRIKGLRVLLGESRAQFGKRFGLTASAIEKWEYGLSMPQAKSQEKLGNLFSRYAGKESKATVVVKPAPAASPANGHQYYTKEEIAKARLATGLSMAGFSKLVGVDRSTLRAWERGKFVPGSTGAFRFYKYMERSKGFAPPVDNERAPTPAEIRECRTALNLNIREFGAKLGVGMTSISDWERGVRPLPDRYWMPFAALREQARRESNTDKLTTPAVLPAQVVSSVQSFKDRRSESLVADALMHVAVENGIPTAKARAIIGVFLHLVHAEVSLAQILKQVTGYTPDGVSEQPA